MSKSTTNARKLHTNLIQADIEPISQYIRNGRPLKLTDNDYDTTCDKLIAYFQHCINNDIPATITGITRTIGYASRQRLFDLMNDVGRPKLSGLVKRAVKVAEECHERGLWKAANAGHIFALKNMKDSWNDNQAVVNQDKATTIVVVTGLSSQKNLQAESQSITIDVDQVRKSGDMLQ